MDEQPDKGPNYPSGKKYEEVDSDVTELVSQLAHPDDYIQTGARSSYPCIRSALSTTLVTLSYHSFSGPRIYSI